MVRIHKWLWGLSLGVYGVPISNIPMNKAEASLYHIPTVQYCTFLADRQTNQNQIEKKQEKWCSHYIFSIFQVKYTLNRISGNTEWGATFKPQ